MRCTHTIDKNAAPWSKRAVQEVGQGHEDRACNTNDLQTLVYFTGSYAQLPSKSPVLPLEVIVPGWLGDRCQVAPPQPIHHPKHRGKADLSLCLSPSLSLPVFPLVCLFLVTSNNYFVITSECPRRILAEACFMTTPGMQSELRTQLGSRKRNRFIFYPVLIEHFQPCVCA